MSADVIIVGGGVIGSAAAYYLSLRGKKVVLLERNYFSSGASGSCDQMVIPQSKAPNEHLTLALASVGLYKQLARDLNRDIEYVQKGGMVLIETPLELETMEGVVAQQRERGLDVELVSVQDALKLQPGLNSEAIVAATHCPVDGEVNPFQLNLGYLEGAAARGAEIHPYTPAESLLTQNGRVVGVKTPKGNFHAPVVVNAAGAWSPLLAETVGLKLPIRPRRGQIYITEAVAPFVHKCTLNARYIVAKHHPETLENDHSAMAKLGVGISLTQSHKGNVLFGSTREFVGYDTSNTYEGLQELLRNAVHLVPGLRNLGIIRAMGGVRPYPPDSKPLVGFSSVEGLFLAAGHEGDGICLSPVTGKMVADLIVDGKTDILAAASCHPGRFDAHS